MRDSEELEQIKEARYEVLRPPLEHCRSTNNSLPPSGYSILPSRIFADARIGGAAIRVMGAVCCHANGRSGLAYPNQRSIAKRLGISQQGVSRQMVTLEKCGYLEKVIKMEVHEHNTPIIGHKGHSAHRLVLKTTKKSNFILPPKLSY